jgi:hypothetical protein
LEVRLMALPMYDSADAAAGRAAADADGGASAAMAAAGFEGSGAKARDAGCGAVRCERKGRRNLTGASDDTDPFACWLWMDMRAGAE